MGEKNIKSLITMLWDGKMVILKNTHISTMIF